MSCIDCTKPTRLVIDVPAAAQPVTLALVKSQANIDASDTYFDTLIEDTYIKVATLHAQDWTSKTFINTSKTVYWGWEFPYCLQIHDAPKLNISDFRYLDTDDIEQVLSPDDYLIETDDHFTNIYAASKSGWPKTSCVPNAITINYTAGFGADYTSVPDDIQLALAKMCTRMLGNRGDCSDTCGSVPCDAQILLSPYRSNYLRNVVRKYD